MNMSTKKAKNVTIQTAQIVPLNIKHNRNMTTNTKKIKWNNATIRTATATNALTKEPSNLNPISHM